MKGRIEVICGPMFSGKTEELLRRIVRAEIAKQKVISFKPAIDNRYSENCIQSHSGLQRESVVVDGEASIVDYLSKKSDKVQVVAIEEIQFFDLSIIDEIKTLVYHKDIRVIVAGLDLDYKGNPFPITADLLSRAEKIDKLHAVCTICGGKATKTAKICMNKNLVDVGSLDKYEARCSFHWMMNGNF